MQKELEEIKILLNQIEINIKSVGSSEIEEIIKNKVNKIKDFISKNAEGTLNKSLIIAQVEEILKLVTIKEKKNSKIFEEFKNYLEKKK